MCNLLIKFIVTNVTKCYQMVVGSKCYQMLPILPPIGGMVHVAFGSSRLVVNQGMRIQA
ncbi:MAG: hypothetical protein QG599_1056 [Pseudomonadota bacterium]|nr:hypothetical protein [Pseudomonadota bacterium]